MKMIRFFTIFLIFISPLVKGQQVYFDSIYQINGNRCQIGWNVLADQDFYLIAGITTDSVYDNTRFFIAKLDSTGNKIWEKSYGETLNHFYGTGTNSLIKTIDNNYALCMGEYYRDLDKIRIMLVKFDNSGDTLWTKRYFYNHYNEAYQCKQTKDHGYIIIGASDSTDVVNRADMTVIKTDSLGNLQWQKFYHKEGTERAYSFDIMGDGDLIIGGWRSNIFLSAEVVRTDSFGNIKWSGTYGTTWGNAGTAVKCLKNGDYVIGYSSGISYDGGATTFYQLRLARLNNNNQVLWDMPYGHLMQDGCSTTIIESWNGDVVVSGAEADSVNYHVRSLILSVDPLGNQRFLRHYEKLPAVNAQNYFYDIKQTNDHGFIAAGMSVSPVTPQYAWVVKVDSVGCQVPFCNVGIEETTIENDGLLLYPNPANDVLNIKYNELDGVGEAKIYNVLGELVLSKEIEVQANKVTLNIAGFEKGFYLLKLSDRRNNWIYLKTFIKN